MSYNKKTYLLRITHYLFLSFFLLASCNTSAASPKVSKDLFQKIRNEIVWNVIKNRERGNFNDVTSAVTALLSLELAQDINKQPAYWKKGGASLFHAYHSLLRHQVNHDLALHELNKPCRKDHLPVRISANEPISGIERNILERLLSKLVDYFHQGDALRVREILATFPILKNIKINMDYDDPECNFLSYLSNIFGVSLPGAHHTEISEGNIFSHLFEVFGEDLLNDKRRHALFALIDEGVLIYNVHAIYPSNITEAVTKLFLSSSCNQFTGDNLVVTDFTDRWSCNSNRSPYFLCPDWANGDQAISLFVYADMLAMHAAIKDNLPKEEGERLLVARYHLFSDLLLEFQSPPVRSRDCRYNVITKLLDPDSYILSLE